MTTVIPYLESGQGKMLKTTIAFFSFAQLISNMHHSIAFEECPHMIYIFSYLPTSANFNVYDVIHIYDAIVLIN